MLEMFGKFVLKTNELFEVFDILEVMLCLVCSEPLPMLFQGIFSSLLRFVLCSINY